MYSIDKYFDLVGRLTFAYDLNREIKIRINKEGQRMESLMI